MSFINTIGQKARNAGNKVSGRTRLAADRSKVEGEIRELNKQKNALYLATGELYYNFATGDEGLAEQLAENIQKITDLNGQIDDKTEQIREIEARVVCPNCGTYHPAGTKVCTKCGYDFVTGKMPEPEVPDEAEWTPLYEDGPRCPNCGAPLEEGAMFCAECGMKIEPRTAAPVSNTDSHDVRHCPNCGAPLEEDALFCAECGTKIEPVEPRPQDAEQEDEQKTADIKFCPACGAVLEEGALFCSKCGTKVAADEPQPAADEPQPVADEPQPVADEPKPAADESQQAGREPRQAPDRESSDAPERDSQ